MNKVTWGIAIAVVAVLLALVSAVLVVQSGWFRGWLEEQASEQLGREVEIGDHDIDWGLPLTLRLSEVRVANVPWADEPMARLDELEVTLNVGRLLRGKVELERVAVQRPEVLLIRREDGTTNIDDLFDEAPTEEQEIPLWPEAFNIDRGRLVFRDEAQGIDLSVAFDTPGESVEELSVDIRGSGRFQDDPVEFQGVLHLEMEARRGAIEAFQGRVGEERLAGSLALDLARDRPWVKAELEADSLDLDRWMDAFGGDDRAPADAQRPLAERLDALRGFEAELDLEVGRLHFAERSFHGVALEASLRDGALSVSRLQATEPLEEGHERQLQLQGELATAPEEAGIEQGRLRYRDTLQEIELEATFEAPEGVADEQRLAVQGEGSIQQDSLAFQGVLHLDLARGRGGIEELEASLGESRLEGRLGFDLERDPAWLEVDLQADVIDLDRMRAWGEALQPAREPDVEEAARPLAERLEVLQAFEGEVDLDIGQVRFEERTFDDIVVQASLRDGQISIPRLEVREPLEDGEERLLQLQGQLDAADPQAAADAVEQGRLRFSDTALGIELEATFEAPEGVADEQRLAVQGEGSIQQDSLAFQGVLHLDLARGRGGIEELEASLGESRLEGRLGFDLERDVPWFALELEADAIDLDRWGLFDERQDETPADEGEWDRGLAQLLEGLGAFEAELDLALGRLHYAGQTLHDLALEAGIEQERLTIEQFQAHQQIGQERPRSLFIQGWLEAEDERVRGHLRSQWDRVDLTSALAPFVAGEVGTLDGNLNVEIIDGALLPENSALEYRAPNLGLELSFTADTRTEGFAGHRVHLLGDGRYEQEPFDFDLLVGALLDLTEPESAYPVSGELTTGATRLWIDGSAVQPFALQAVEGNARLEGPSPAELTDLTGINLPELPPYEVSGYIRYRGDLLNIDGLEGAFGDSDVSGDVRIRFGEPASIWATLVSRQLESDDLLPMLGMAPQTGAGETVSPEQQQWAAQDRQADRLFADREWDLEALRNTHIVLDYEAANVQAERLPFEDLELALELEEGVMTVDPLQMGLGGGQVTASWVMDAGQAAIEGEIDLALERIDLADILDEAGLPEVARDTLGVFGGHGEFHYRGRSMHQVMAGLNGQLELAMSQGWLDIIAAELLPLNVANALVAALTGEDQARLECTYINFEVEHGLADLADFFMATEIAHFEGAGAINLATERMDMAFQGHNIDPTLFTGNTPIELQGTLRDPEVNIITQELIARGALSLLGAIVAPPMAILPWVDPGGGEQVGMGCDQALAEFHE